ncbi:MAG: hypothetical protein GX640_04915 [Fibrobacter sp.]|nr:hypothetical protein [Fibrobacter sp.]
MSSDAASFFLDKISITDSFAVGAEKIASFLLKFEERWDVVDVLEPVFSDECDRKIQEYIIFCLLDIRRADIATLQEAIRYKRLRQLFARQHNKIYPLCENEMLLLNEIRNQTRVGSLQLLEIAAKICSTWMGALLETNDLEEKSRLQFAALLKGESVALKERSNYLSDHVDSYNMKAIARLMPLLTMCDEYAKSLEDLGTMILQRKIIGAPVLTVQQLMRKESFEKLLKNMTKSSVLQPVVTVVNLQRAKLSPVQNLLAATTLCRWTLDSSAVPLQWIKLALDLLTQEEFSIDVGEKIGLIKPFLHNTGVEINGTVLKIDFRKNILSPLIGTDMLTRNPAAEKEISVVDLVMRNMGNDVLLARLLDNPKVFNKPGLIERIVTMSRSMVILHKIASTRELYTGQANTGVPLALLKNPTAIPMTLLRMFINPTYVSLPAMKELLRNPYGIRNEVQYEVKSFVERKR